jgi:tight adherence protein C
MLTLITLSIFISVALLVSALLYSFLSKRDIKRRVASLVQNEILKPEIIHVQGKWELLLADMGEKLRISSGDLGTYRSTITAAGFRKESVRVFLGGKVFLALALPAGYLVLYALPHAKILSKIPILVSLALAISGYLLPTIWKA